MRPIPRLWWASLLAVLALALVLAAEPVQAQDLARGEQLFELCSHCHGTAAQGSALALAPSIAGLEPWYIEAQLHKFRDGSRATHFDDLAGLRMRGMARWLKTEDDVKAVAAYVGSLAPVKQSSTLGGDASKGAALYPVCAGCHGMAGEGVKDVSGPSLVHVSDWYLLTQLKNFKQGIRGSDPRDVTGGAMRPMAMILADEQAMKDVIAHIGTLVPPASGGSE